MKKEIREINTPAIDLIADILDKHVDAILEEVRSRFKQIKADHFIEADRQTRNCGQCVPLSTDGTAVFIDGIGEVSLDFSGQARDEPVLYQSRTRPIWAGASKNWTAWENCTKDQADDYRRVKVLHDWEYEVRELYTAPQPQQLARGEPVAWYTEDHKTDRSATTWNRTVAARWRDKGWPVGELFAAPQPQQTPDKDIPEGFKLVPIEPTEEMLRAAYQAVESETVITTVWLRKTVYKAMLEAAPASGEES